MAALLIERGADVNARDPQTVATPLYHAASWGRLPVVQLLLEKGADVNAKNKAGTTPLKAALDNGFEEIVALLRTRGAK
jgi:ankyrin repeat protein